MQSSMVGKVQARLIDLSHSSGSKVEANSGSSRLLLIAVVLVAALVIGFVAFPTGLRPVDTNPSSTTNTVPNPSPTLSPTSNPTSKPTPIGDIVTDADGNIYRTVKIGNQTWMAENLKTIKYNDGQDIPLVTSSYAWGSLKTPAYCWLNNDPTNKDAYGTLYNWYTVDTGKLAPKGWHVPTEEDWATLAKYLGGDAVAGGKLKASGTSHWFAPNTQATDEVGFTAIPCSTRNYDGYHFYKLGDSCYFWSAAEFDAAEAWVRQMACDSAALKSFHGYKSYGRPVRCIKDP